jgi:hypothetical protein
LITLPPQRHLQPQIQAALGRLEQKGWTLTVRMQANTFGFIACPYDTCRTRISMQYPNPDEHARTFDEAHARHLRVHGE